MSAKRRGVWVALAAALAIGIYFAARPPVSGVSTLHALCLPTASSGEIRPEQFRGKVTLLVFWATWCAPCRQEMPGIQSLYARYHRRGLQVFGVSLGEGVEAPRDFRRYYALTFPVAFTDRTQAQELCRRLRINSIPYTVILDRQGAVRYSKVGVSENDARERERMVKRLLAER